MSATIGMPKAPVLPLPVCAFTIRSVPRCISGTTRACTGMGFDQPSAATPRCTASGSASNVNSSIVMRAHYSRAARKSRGRACYVRSMSIAREEVKRITALARLSLPDDELDRLQRELGAILSYVETLAAVDTTGVEPTAHVIPLATPLRDDVPEPAMDPAL